MKAHPRSVRLEVLSAYDGGEPAESVAERYGIAICNIRNWRKLRDETGDVMPRPHGGGPSRRLDETGLARLVALRLEYPEESVETLVVHLAEEGLRVARQTASRYLHDAGFVRYAVKSSAKPAMSDASKDARPRRYRKSPSPPALAHRRAYPSDLTDAEWILLEPLLPPSKPGGRREAHSRREIVNAIFYVLRSGCQWRMLPHDFPPWETVYDDFRCWRGGGIWEKINQALREKVRERAGREKTPSAVIIDSQSVKTTEKGGRVDMTEQSD